MENEKNEKEQERLQDFVNTIFQNTSTAIQSIDEILTLNKDEEFLKELNREKQGYLDYKNKVLEFCSKNGLKADDNNWLEKTRLFTSIKMTTLFDKSLRHLAEMMLLGTVMGTLTCYKDLSDYKGLNSSLYGILNDLIAFEEENFNKIKQFLKE